MTRLKSLCGTKFLLIALFALAACSPKVEGWDNAAPPVAKKNAVEWSVASHELRFVPGSRWLAPGELSRLDAFLTKIDVRRPVHVFVETGGPDVPKTLADSRTATMHALLRARGVVARDRPPEMAPGSSALASADNPDTASLLIGHYDVTTPGCPDWRKPTITDFSNQHSSNFGCASEMNLGMMVADPRDLVRGRDEGLADGTRSSSAVAGYRKGKLPVLPEESASSGVGGE